MRRRHSLTAKELAAQRPPLLYPEEGNWLASVTSGNRLVLTIHVCDQSKLVEPWPAAG